LYPRLHSSLPLLIKELFREKRAQIETNLNMFIQIILEDAIFNEDKLSGSKYTTIKQHIIQTLLLESLNIRSTIIRNV